MGSMVFNVERNQEAQKDKQKWGRKAEERGHQRKMRGKHSAILGKNQRKCWTLQSTVLRVSFLFFVFFRRQSRRK